MVGRIVRVVGTMIVTTALLVTGGLAAAAEPGEETLGNNLSVPAVFVPGTGGAPTLRLGCPPGPIAPDGPQSATFPGYWLQKTAATWSAACATRGSASVVADWGDNLTRSTTLKAGMPIRVEVGLLTTTDLTGFVITNLTPDQLDRLATYGTDGSILGASALGTRVWDSDAWLRIQKDGVTIHEARMTAEINSMGAVVYGYNWGIKGRSNTPATGDYVLTFTVSGATSITGLTDGGAANPPTFTDHSTSLGVRIAKGTGGGKR